MLIAAFLLALIDADTYLILYRMEVGKGPLKAIWVEQQARLYGVDTPESFRPRCQKEKDLAAQAKQAVRRLFPSSEAFVVIHKEPEKYGRALVSLYNADKVDIAGELMKRGLARSYQGGTKRSWCGTSISTEP